MNPLIKICGITNANDARTATECGTDAVGFIFYKESPRYITPERAADIIKELPDHIFTVGVFVNHKPDDVKRIIDQTGINVIQLHGNEKPDACNHDSVKVWKAIRIVNRNELSMLNEYSVDAFVFDTYHKKLYGGTGKTGNWQLARKASEKYKVILSGGLYPGNIADAISTVNPFGVDINSGIESAPGKKDKQKLLQLFTKIHKKGVTHAHRNEIHSHR